MNHLPDCPCGANDWQGAGGHYSPNGQYYGRTCGRCGKDLHNIGRDGWWLLFIHPTTQREVLEDYANTSLAIQARAYAAKWKAVNKAHQKVLFDALCREWGLAPEKGVEWHPLETKYDTGLGYETWDFDYLDNEGNRLDLDAHAFREACHTLWDANPEHPSMVRAPDPINVPDGITAYVSRNKIWDLVPLQAGLQPIPLDPLRQGWITYWGRVWSLLKEATGITVAPEEVPNEYSKDPTNAEPWWKFTIGRGEFLVGPRHRVVNIEVSSETPFPTATLRALAGADKVTFTAQRPWEQELEERLTKLPPARGDGFKAWEETITRLAAEAAEANQDAADESTKMVIHAYSQAKVVEYLTLAIQSVS